jgi:hypothetical protein
VTPVGSALRDIELIDDAPKQSELLDLRRVQVWHFD